MVAHPTLIDSTHSTFQQPNTGLFNKPVGIRYYFRKLFMIKM